VLFFLPCLQFFDFQKERRRINKKKAQKATTNTIGETKIKNDLERNLF
jgi:hypothetical protein